VAAASDKELRLCIFIDPLTDSNSLVKFLEENEFQKEIKGLELIIGKTDWDDTDEDSKQESEE